MRRALGAEEPVNSWSQAATEQASEDNRLIVIPLFILFF